MNTTRTLIKSSIKGQAEKKLFRKVIQVIRTVTFVIAMRQRVSKNTPVHLFAEFSSVWILQVYCRKLPSAKTMVTDAKSRK